MPYSIGFEHRLSGRTVEDAYRIAEAWLRDQQADIRNSRPPGFIEAAHGRKLQPMGWRKDARKTIVFEFQAAGPDVIVKARFVPATLNTADVVSRSDEATANWNELLAELWERFGERGALAEAVQRPPVDWNRSLQQGRGLSATGLCSRWPAS